MAISTIKHFCFRIENISPCEKIFVVIVAFRVCFDFNFLSYKGHRAVATIAQKHLTSNTAYVVSAYLKGESMADVSTWADENKTRATAPWHFLNLPLGLPHEHFIQTVSQSDNNVYTAILKTEASLKDNSLSFNEKNEALKYLVEGRVQQEGETTHLIVTKCYDYSRLPGMLTPDLAAQARLLKNTTAAKKIDPYAGAYFENVLSAEDLQRPFPKSRNFK